MNRCGNLSPSRRPVSSTDRPSPRSANQAEWSAEVEEERSVDKAAEWSAGKEGNREMAVGTPSYQPGLLMQQGERQHDQPPAIPSCETVITSL
jgi:hypothetical protein